MKIASQQDERIRKLEDDLYFARQTVLELMSPRAQEILESPSRIASPRAVHLWFRAAAEQVLGLADVVEITQSARRAQRAVCPYVASTLERTNMTTQAMPTQKVFAGICSGRAAPSNAPCRRSPSIRP